MLTPLRLPPRGPHFTTFSPLNFYSVKRSRRRTIKNIAGLHIERAFMTRALESFVFFLEIDGARQVSAFLPVGVILRFGEADENRCVLLRRIAEIERGADRHVGRIRN